MEACSTECVPVSDDEESGGLPHSVRRPVRLPAYTDCEEGIVTDEEGGPSGQHCWAAPPGPPQGAWQQYEEEEPSAALRQLNGQLPAHSSQQQVPVRKRAFTRSAPAPAAKPLARAGAGGRGGFRRPMRTAAAVHADLAAQERAAADAAELAASLGAAEAEGADGQEESKPQRQRELDIPLPSQRQPTQQQQPAAAVPLTRAPPATTPVVVGVAAAASQAAAAAASQAATRPARRPAFLNRKVLPRPPSRPEEQLQPADSSAMPESADSGAVTGGTNSRPSSSQPSGSMPDECSQQQQQKCQQRSCAPVLLAAGTAASAAPRAAAAASLAAVAAAPARAPAQANAPRRGVPAARGASAATAAAGSAGATVPAATFHRTADGLNVIYFNRQAQQAQQAAQQAEGAGGAEGGGKARGKDVNSGWGNNFVKMDLKKGKGSTKYGTKYGSKKKKKAGGRGGSKWQVSRLRQVGDGSDFLEGWRGSKLRCYKCGGGGHFAKDCTAEQQAQADMGALLCSSDEEEGSEGEDGAATAAAAAMGAGAAGAGATHQQQQQHQQAGGAAAAPSTTTGNGSQRILSTGSLPPGVLPPEAVPGDPAERYAAVLADASEAALTGVLQEVFGHPAFRGLQLATVQRLLAGESLLSIMPTGMGKSLCYQLPAVLLPGLTLVVSPLIALMHDQAASVPPPLTAAVLWSGQSRADALQVLADVANGRIKVLFVSPERLGNPHLLQALAPRMPLPLVVVDEAHCVAEWGHSFRPAYFRLGMALLGAVRAQRILALTATATRPTEGAIRQVLRIPAGSVLRDAAVRQNLRLQVLRTAGGGSSQSTRDRICALFSNSGPLASVRSAIVYCAFKEDANQLARLMSVRNINARAYHAGKDYRERAAVESDFAAGRVRIVVATVAFGMGINLARVGAVVHATMPRSLEEYVQQIGRAGRDGSEARCVAMLDDGDFVRLRSLAFSSVVDLAAVRGFLEAIFSPAAEGQKSFRRGSAKAQAKAKAAADKAAAKAAAAAAKGGGGGGKGRKRKAAGGEEAAGGSKRKAAAAAAAREEEVGKVEEAEAAGAAETDCNGGLDEQQEQGQQQQQPGQQLGQEEGMEDISAAAAAPAADIADATGECPRRFGVLASKKLAAELDMREDSQETILSYLEAEDGSPCLRMLPSTSMSVKISFYSAAAEQLAQRYPVVQSVLDSCQNPRNGVYSCPAAKLAGCAQQAPGLVLQELREMAAGGLIGFELSREEGPAYEILHTPSDLDAMAAEVYARLAAVLSCQVSRLDMSYRALSAALQAGQAATGLGPEERLVAQEAALRAAVERYFDDEEPAGSDAEVAAAVETAGGDVAAAVETAGGSDDVAAAVETAGGSADGAADQEPVGGDADVAVGGEPAGSDTDMAACETAGGAADVAGQPAGSAAVPAEAAAVSGAEAGCQAAAAAGGSAGGAAATAGAAGSVVSTSCSSLLLDTSGLPLKRAEPALLGAARAALRSNREQGGAVLSGRALARMLHGLSSPAFPQKAWGKRMGAFWGSQTHVDFGAVLRAAEIVVRGEPV